MKNSISYSMEKDLFWDFSMRPVVAIIRILETLEALQSFSEHKLKMFLIHAHNNSI